mgnify:CR=1 FL=1
MKGIEIGQRVDAYHDGKASPSRLAVVVIDDIIDRDDLSEKGQRHWRKALKQDFNEVFEGCIIYTNEKSPLAIRQFWDWNCTEFIVGHILNDKETMRDPMLFAKRPEGFGW